MSNRKAPGTPHEPRPGLERLEEVKGEAPVEVGRDPRALTPEELRALGHEAMSPLRAIRLRCLDCCGGSAKEVRRCVAVGCPSWPYRMGTNPHRRKSEARRAAGRRAAARLNKDRVADRNQQAPSTAKTGAGDGDSQVGPASTPRRKRAVRERAGTGPDTDEPQV